MPKTDPKDVEAKQIQDNSVTPEAKGEENQGPTIVMTGVSGKKITADVKVVKVKKAKRRPAEPDASTGADLAPAKTPAPVPASTRETPVATQPLSAAEPSEPKSVQVSDKTPEVAPVQTPVAKPAPAEIVLPAKPVVEQAPTPRTEPKPAVASAEPVQPVQKADPVATPDPVKPEVTPEAASVTAQTPVQPAPAAPKTARPATPVSAPRTKRTSDVRPDRSSARVTKSAPPTETTAQTKSATAPAAPAETKTDAASETPAQGVAGTKVDPAKSSLAATAAYFAARAAARKKAAEQRIQQADQRTGSGRPNKDRRDGGTARPPRSGGGGYAGGGAGRFAKDKDEEPKLQSHSRTPARRPSPMATEILGNPKESSRSAFAARGDRKGDRRTDRRDFDNRRNARGGRRFNGGEDEFGRGRRRQNRKRDKSAVIIHAVLTNISLPAIITVKEFAEAIKKTSAEVIKALMKFGVMATLNQEIDYDTASIIANEFGIKTERLVEVTEEDILFDDSDDTDEDLQTRPPVVCVMGHVDHGKTSLLDRIRSTEVAHGEAGGITQHIGAYMVDLNGRKITFLDTPGHEAFTTMRARGAQATDIAILVVAADDGVMPQTIEAINHAKAANTQIIVAINKMDRPGANADRVKEELAKYELISEEWGGSTTMVPVSAKTGEGIEELLEMVLLTADILDLKANPDRQAKGIVIEAKLDKQRGPVATLLVQRGTLHVGDTVVMGESVGRVRAMTDAKGANRQEAGPSVPVEIIGIPDVPGAGEIFYQVENEKVARQLAEKRRVQNREKSISGSSRMSLENLFSQMASGEVKELNLIIKADVQGSVEAVNQAMLKLSNDEVKVKIVHSAVGAITESDLNLAEVANAIVIGFNVRPSANVADQAKANGIDLRLYRVIYQAIEDVEAAMKGLLAPKLEVVELGQVEIRQVFKASNIGTIGGGYVTHGKVVRNCKARLVRDGVQIWEGGLASLKRFKDDVREVAQGYECGISLENYNDIKEGDVIEAYTLQEVERD